MDSRIAVAEDFVPSDVRLDVRVRWGESLYRLMPGSLERPVAMIERARLVARVIDPVLLDRLGFGLDDMCELILTHVDSACEVMASIWGKERTGLPDQPAKMNEMEVAQARTIPDPLQSVSRCRNPERALRALKWATLSSVPYAPSGPGATLGTALRVRRQDGTVLPIPVGFCPEALDTLINELASLAATADPQLDDVFFQRSAVELARVVRSLQMPVQHRVRVGPTRWIHSLVTFDRHTQLAVDLTAGITPGALQGDGEESRLETLEVDGVDVVRVRVSASPGHLLTFSHSPRVVATTLDDLSWIVRRCAHQPEDVFMFFQELLEHPNVRQLLGLETINAFEHWQQNGKCLFKQGAAYDFAVLALHQGEEEWREAALRKPLEEALLKLGLDRTAVWNTLDVSSERAEARLGQAPKGPAWLIRTEPPVIGINVFTPETYSPTVPLLFSLAEGMLWRLTHSASVLDIIARAVHEIGAFKAILRPTDVDESKAVICPLGWEGDALVIGFDNRLQAYCEQHSTGIEDVIGCALAAGLAKKGADATEFVVRWSETPPGFRMDAARLPVGQERLPDPHQFSTAHESIAARDLATRLRQQEATPGQYEGRAATALESESVYPCLIAMLDDATARFDGAALLDYALSQLECALCKQHINALGRGWNQQFPVLDYNPIEHQLSEEKQAARLARSIRVAIEEIILRHPSGTRTPDLFAWWRILAIADLLLASGIRSDSNRYGLVAITTSISEMYEISQREVGDSLIDGETFHRTRATTTLPHFSPIPQADLDAVASAMKAGQGYRPETVGLVLNTIAAWQVKSPDFIGRTTRNALIAACYEVKVGDLEEHEILAALDALTLCQTDLVAEPPQHWEQERRQVRLMTRPIIKAADETFRVLPWQSHATWKTFQAYLGEGRCMWPLASMSPHFQQALQVFREKRNRALEDDVAEQFRQVTQHVRVRIKKAKVLGLTRKIWGNNEIDVIALEVARRILWVVEAKDLFVPFAPATLRRSYEKYFEPGKGYVEKLLTKATIVSRNRKEILRALGVEEDGTAWRVVPIMVTRRVEPGGFARAAPVRFCAIGDLVESVSKWP